MAWRERWASLGLALVVGVPAYAQHASDNAVLSAEDAFGVTIGTESIGIYDQNQIRGFNPQVAGNARIGGLYFDQQAPLSNRVIEGSSIRVGVSAIGYAFPAPTGIVDYGLRRVGDKAQLTAVLDAGPFDGGALELDGEYPIASLNLGIPMGLGYESDAMLPGYTSRNVSLGVAPRWTPREGLAVRAFWDWHQITEAKTAPLFFMGAPELPPHVAARYLGQAWADGKSLLQNYGMIVDAELSRRWTLSGGIFRSINDSPVSFADLYVDTQRSGAGDHLLIGYPDQRISSTSGEVRLTGHFTQASARHEVVISLRGRDALQLYGGSDVREVGTAFIGQQLPIATPDFVYGPLTRDENRLWIAGLAYHGRWWQRGELSLGIQKAEYVRSVVAPDAVVQRRTDNPWRAYTILGVNVSKRIDVFAGFTQGIEDSGVAPSVASNRGEILPALRTWQRDAGLQFALTPSVKLIAGIFDVHKPYFNLDPSSLYVDVGEQEHRGYEFSLAGEVLKGLNIVAGLELLKADIDQGSGPAPGGPLAVGQNNHLAQINLDYKLADSPFSLDLTLYSFGRREANFDNSVSIPATQSADVGARYRFAIGGADASLRLLVQNIGNVYSWALTDSAGYSPAPRRSAQLYLTVDF